MNRHFTTLFAMAALLGHALADEPSHISDEDVNRLYDRILNDTAAHEAISPDGKLKAVYRQIHPGIYGCNFGRVAIYNSGKKAVASFDLTDYAGRLVAVARWSPDSRFCVFTTISAGGHSPWHSTLTSFPSATRLSTHSKTLWMQSSTRSFDFPNLPLSSSSRAIKSLD
jgi:Tol biopolymer transport system component